MYEGGWGCWRAGARGPGHATRGDGRGRPGAVAWPLGNAVERDVARDRAGAATAAAVTVGQRRAGNNECPSSFPS